MSVCIHSIDISFHHSCRIPAFTEILPPLLSRGGGREKEALQCKRIRRDSWRGEGDCLLWNRLSGRTKHNGGGNIVKLLSKAGGCVALRVGVVENKHISGKNSPRRKKKCPQRSPDVQWESTGTEKNLWSCSQREWDVMNVPSLACLPTMHGESQWGCFVWDTQRTILKCLEIFATLHVSCEKPGC